MQVGRKTEASDTIIPTGGGTYSCGLKTAAQNAVTTLLKFPNPLKRFACDKYICCNTLI
jgi:hypothetical protein